MATGQGYSNRTVERRITNLGTHPHAYLTVPAFAQYLNVPDKTVRKRIRAGVLPAYCFQGEWRIARTDALLFIQRERIRR